MKKLNDKGQGLIEAVLALGVAVLIVSAIAIVVVTSVNNSNFGKNQNLATQYAQQGIELLKQQSRSDWPTFANYSGTYCLPENSTSFAVATSSACLINIGNTFVRKIVISQNNASCGLNAKVTVSVSWSDGKCTNQSNPYCHSVSLDSCFANINAVPTP